MPSLFLAFGISECCWMLIYGISYNLNCICVCKPVISKIDCEFFRSHNIITIGHRQPPAAVPFLYTYYIPVYADFGKWFCKLSPWLQFVVQHCNVQWFCAPSQHGWTAASSSSIFCILFNCGVHQTVAVGLLLCGWWYSDTLVVHAVTFCTDSVQVPTIFYIKIKQGSRYLLGNY